MNPNSRNLAMRDPAMAALFGVTDASDFGGEYTNDDQDNSDFGHDADYGVDFGFGTEFGVDFGADTMAPAAAAALGNPANPSSPLHPANRQALMNVWMKAHQDQALSNARERILEPNKGSSTKVERYSFSLNQAVILGAVLAVNAAGNPDVNIRPQRVTMNAPAPGFVTITEIKVANVSITVGGIDDAFNYNANGVGQHLDLPTLSPANRAQVLGAYTGFVPPGYVAGAGFLFVVGLKGPASIVA